MFNNELEKQRKKLNLHTILNDNLFHELHEINPTSAKRKISIMKSLVLSSELLNDQTSDFLMQYVRSTILLKP